MVLPVEFLSSLALWVLGRYYEKRTLFGDFPMFAGFVNVPPRRAGLLQIKTYWVGGRKSAKPSPGSSQSQLCYAQTCSQYMGHSWYRSTPKDVFFRNPFSKMPWKVDKLMLRDTFSLQMITFLFSCEVIVEGCGLWMAAVYGTLIGHHHSTTLCCEKWQLCPLLKI